MKALINELYQCPMSPEFRNYIINGLGFSEEDKKIIISLMQFDADSNFHYENTGINREKFERHLNRINRVLLPEIIRLAQQTDGKLTTK